jgi:hypothetical protein
MTCHWHPSRETRLQCGRCGKAICVECMRQHPVGVRCKECARMQQLPTYRFEATDAMRGILAMLVVGAAAGGLLYLIRLLPGSGFFVFFLWFGLGIGVAEAISAAVNKRRGRPYQYIAAGTVLLAFGTSWLLSIWFRGGAFIDLWQLFGIVLATVAATSRLRA